MHLRQKQVKIQAKKAFHSHVRRDIKISNTQEILTQQNMQQNHIKHISSI